MERGNGSFISYAEQYRHNVDKEMARRDEEKMRAPVKLFAKHPLYSSVGIFTGLLMLSWFLYVYL